TQQEAAVGVAVERNAPTREIIDGTWSGTGDALDRHWVAQAGAGCQGVGRVKRRLVVGADRNSDAALRPGTGGARPKRSFGKYEAGEGREVEGGHQPGETGADDDGLSCRRPRNAIHEWPA